MHNWQFAPFISITRFSFCAWCTHPTCGGQWCTISMMLFQSSLLKTKIFGRRQSSGTRPPLLKLFFEDIFETVTYVSKIHRSGPKLINVVKEISSKGSILTSGQQIWVWIYIIGWNSNEILLHHDNWNQGSVVPINIISIESFIGCTILMSSIFANNWGGLRTRLHPKMISAMSLTYRRSQWYFWSFGKPFLCGSWERKSVGKVLTLVELLRWLW